MIGVHWTSLYRFARGEKPVPAYAAISLRNLLELRAVKESKSRRRANEDKTVSAQLATTVREEFRNQFAGIREQMRADIAARKEEQESFLEKLQERFVEMLLRGLEADRADAKPPQPPAINRSTS